MPWKRPDRSSPPQVLSVLDISGHQFGSSNAMTRPRFHPRIGFVLPIVCRETSPAELLCLTICSHSILSLISPSSMDLRLLSDMYESIEDIQSILLSARLRCKKKSLRGCVFSTCRPAFMRKFGHCQGMSRYESHIRPVFIYSASSRTSQIRSLSYLLTQDYCMCKAASLPAEKRNTVLGTQISDRHISGYHIKVVMSEQAEDVGPL